MIKDKNCRIISQYTVVKDPYGDYWCILSTELSATGLIQCRNGCSFIYWEPGRLEVVL